MQAPEKDQINFKIYPGWREKMLAWIEKQYPFFCYFNPNGIAYPGGAFPHVLHAGTESQTLENLHLLPSGKPKVGIISYDQKNRYEMLVSNNPAWISCPDTLFFSSLLTFEIRNTTVSITGADPKGVWNAIIDYDISSPPAKGIDFTLPPSYPQKDYKSFFKAIQNNIFKGDVYELNFCMGYKGYLSPINSLEMYLDLCRFSPMPFSAYFKANDLIVLSASPERFLKKKGNLLLTQPIKGSTKRGQTVEEDAALKSALFQSEKERAENLMIVDLMRNDLSRIAEVGSVTVEELFGIYSFQQITQMISTVSCMLKTGTTFEQIISKTFPMGSMTGAPKIKSMELIDLYENFKRGWFSGTLGYIDTQGNFDFNVIIRSLILDTKNSKYFFGVGSAITSGANATDEYNECLLKAESMIRTIKNQNSY